jgi:hypothetical protein
MPKKYWKRTTPEALAKDALYQRKRRQDIAKAEKRTPNKDGRPCKMSEEEATELMKKIKDDLDKGIFHTIAWFIEEV